MKSILKTATVIAAVSLAAVTAFAQTASPVQSFTEQIREIKKGDPYKIFTMSGEGLVALGPVKPKGLKDAFSPDIVVASAEFENDSVDIQGFSQVKSIIFSRASGDVEASIFATKGEFPYFADAKDRTGSDHVVLLVDGDFYFLKLNTMDDRVQGEDRWGEIDFIISKNKLAGMKGDPKSKDEYNAKVRNYYSSIRAEKAKIIAAAIEKQRKENSLEGRDVKNIDLVMEYDYVSPGLNTRIGVIANLKDGSQLKTLGVAKGKTFWSDYKVTVTGGSFDGKGNLTTSEQYNAANKDQVTFTIQSIYISTLKITKTVNINYTRSYKINLVTDGGFGTDGGRGVTGNCMKGKAAGNGGNADAGGNGSNAGVVTVKVTNYTHAQTKETLLKYEIVTSQGTFHYVAAPSSAVVINANGGNGGNGGSGGSAGMVSSANQNGGSCDCASSVVYMGNGGNGGRGGNGGNGGSVTVTVDPSVANYQLDVTVEGGSGGSGGFAGATDVADGCFGDGTVRQARETKSGKPGANGTAGQKGTVTTNKAKVTLSW